MDPATMALIGAGVSAGGSILGGYLGKPSSKETKMQKTKRKLVDQLLSSLNGKGPYKDLYNFDENVFNKSFVEPAMAKFRNQVAPQIQQQFISSGQQRGTGLDDQLLRAGVEMDQLLNEHMAGMQEGAQNRKQGTINSILGSGDGAQPGMSSGDAIKQATSGYLSSDSFTKSVDQIMDKYTNKGTSQPQAGMNMKPTRKGYEPDWNTAKNMPLGHPGWGG